MTIRMLCVAALFTTACGTIGNDTFSQPEPAAVVYSVPGERDVQTAPLDTESVRYQSVGKPVSELIAEPPDTLFTPEVADASLPFDTPIEAAECPGVVNPRPSYFARSIAEDNEPYNNELTSGLPRTSLTYDRYNHRDDDYEASDYEVEFSRPSSDPEESGGSKSVDPSPIRSNSKRLPNLR